MRACRRKSRGMRDGVTHERMKERRVWPGDWLSFVAAPLSTCLSTVGVEMFARRTRASCWSSSEMISSPSGIDVGVLAPLSGVRPRPLTSFSESFQYTLGRRLFSTSFILFDSSAKIYDLSVSCVVAHETGQQT